MYTILVNKCHCRIISKALDIYKYTLRGDLRRIPLLYAENKTTYINANIITESDFDFYISELRNKFFEIDVNHFKRYVNILEYKEHGINLVNVKKRMIDTCSYFSSKNIDNYIFKLTLEELIVIKLACDLYWNVQIANFDYINDINVLKDKINSHFMQEIKDITLSTKQFASHSCCDIMSPSINRKGKWCYDISNTIDYFLKGDQCRLVGTLNRLIIKKHA